MNTMKSALISKDIRGITANNRLLVGMISVPIIMTVFIPSIFIMLIHFNANNLISDFNGMLSMLPTDVQPDNMKQIIISLIINNVLPIFFIIIPIMTSSIMATSSFVGEKEKRTLETLLYCPLSLKQIFKSKVLSSFIMSELVTILSFIIMTVVTQTEIFLTTGSLILPNISWLVVLLILSPAVSLITITLIVHGSAKAQTMEESQQLSSLLILPVVFLVVGQFAGILFINIWILLELSAILAVIAYILINFSFSNKNYESMLS